MPTNPKLRIKRAPVRELHVTLEDSDFDTLVEQLRQVLVVPELPGFKGCAPCRSGLDRLVIEDPIFRDLGGRGTIG